MKVSVSSYSFISLLQKGEMSLLDCIEKTKALGLDAIEFAGFPQLPEGTTALDMAHTLREASQRAELPIVSYTINADLFYGFKGATNGDEEVERLKREVDVAAALGVSLMRHDVTGGFKKAEHRGCGFNNLLPMLAKQCREITEYAEQKGIRTMVENHGFFAQDSDRIEILVNAVAHPNFGVICDMGNFLCADEDPVTAVSRLAPYTFLVHAKDFHVKSGMGPNPGRGFWASRGGNFLRSAIIGHGDVPVLQCLRALKRAGYFGDDKYVSVEFEGMEDPIQGISIGAENLRRYIGLL